ncbi:MAG: BlaI/MecI/CopY family transcriptional regulator [Planctomycetota bacterium]
MTKDFRSPSDAETGVLDVLWCHGPQTVRQVAVELYGSPSSVQYRTVQVQLDRLAKKGLVERLGSGTPKRFRAKVDRARLIHKELQSMADKVCEGSLAPLLLNLACRVRLSDAEREELQKLLEEDGDE